MNLLLDIFAVLAIGVMCCVSPINLKAGVLVGLTVKPIIDTAWDRGFFGFSLIDLHSILFLFLASLLLLNRFRAVKANFILFFLWLLAHVGVVFLLFTDPIRGLESIARLLYLPVGLSLFWCFWRDDEWYRPFLTGLLYSSLVPAAIILLQGAGVIETDYVRSTKGLERAVGFYHDIVTSRIYLVQGLISLYLCAKLKCGGCGRGIYSTCLLMAFVIASFFIFSKAMIGILLVGLLLYLLCENWSGAVYGAGILVILALPFIGVFVAAAIQALFIQEVGYYTGELDSSRLLSGRGMLFQNYMEQFYDASNFEKVFGQGTNEGRTHNEFLRFLTLSGVFGLLFYSLMIAGMCGIAFRSWLLKKPYAFIATWCAAMILIDSIGVVWGLYPNYLVIVLGFWSIGVRSNLARGIA